MKKLLLLITSLYFPLSGYADEHSQASMRIWFDIPNPSVANPVWNGASSLSTCGDGPANLDPNWENYSLPIGNGNIGANIMGSIQTERITFNEKSLWRGGPNTCKNSTHYWDVNKQSASILKEIREAFIQKDIDKATQLTQDHFNGKAAYNADGETPFRFGSFTSAGEFQIKTDIPENNIQHYNRSLSLDSALATVEFTHQDIHYQRNYFISYPDNVMVIRFSASEKGKQNLTFTYSPNPLSSGSFKKDGKNGISYIAQLNDNQMQYAVRIKVLTQGGKVENTKDKLIITAADEVTFLITADTDYFMNFSPDYKNPKTYVGVNPIQTTQQWMEQAARQSYSQLFQKHYADYSSLFKRNTLSINPQYTSQEVLDLSIPKRLERYRTGAPDYDLEALYYQFGRYLLIASSRPGNLPANLQGIWHNNIDGPWRVDYHNNINIQMNYWPACPTNLAECEKPLIDFIRTLVKPGEVTARSYYNARGWTASISSNIFGFTSPLRDKDMTWNFSPVAGPWLATHVWNYYDYTRDLDFLKQTGYELIKSSAQFAVDYLWKKPDGTYTAAPSTSPEHGPIDEGATFSHAVIREILLDAIEASKILETDETERKQWEEVLSHLAPYRIGRYGQLMEWSTDIDDPNDDHRHVNHLFGLHPGHTLSPITTPQLARAARVVLEHRGDGATGWSMGWKLNQWARLQDGNRAYTLFGNLLKNGTNDNLWDSHPPFQIDGNFGGTAGITEMLLQSHMGFIQLLPALPAVWHEGSFTGVRARGNFSIDMKWKDNNLTQAVVHSGSGGVCHLHYKGEKLSFNTESGKSYIITYTKGKLTLNP